MEWTKDVRKALDHLLSVKTSSKVAVFDADGTLWREDIGESFFKYQIKKALAPHIKGIEDPWALYKKKCEINTKEAYVWLAQINEGLSESELLRQSEEFSSASFQNKINPQLKSLFDELRKAAFDIWICSASIKWALLPALKELGISESRLISTETHVEKKKITDRPVEPVPYKDGKKEAIERKIKEQPLFVAGNSMGDYDMLGLAKILPLVIVHLPHLEEVKKSEQELMKVAQNKNWLIQTFQ